MTVVCHPEPVEGSLRNMHQACDSSRLFGMTTKCHPERAKRVEGSHKTTRIKTDAGCLFAQIKKGQTKPTSPQKRLLILNLYSCDYRVAGCVEQGSD